MALLAVGLVERAPEASAANQAFQAPLTSNPLTVGDGASFSADPGTSPAPPTRYEAAVLADKPTLYLPLTETAGTIAFDHSGNGLDGTYAPSVTHEGPGPLLDEPNVAVYGNGQEVFQSGDSLPSASASRTLEIWVHNTAAAYDPIRYGDVEHGHGFAVRVGGDHITVEASGREVSAATTDGLGHGGSMGDCCDATGWHMVDVTYDGSAVEIYEDGQLIGGGTLGEAETSLPGQGLRLEASSEEITCPYGACEHAGAPPYGIGQAAIYPTVLSSAAIGAHWSAGASLQEEALTCSSTPSGPYPDAVLGDAPVAYYPLDDLAPHPGDRVAFDASGHCANGTYDIGTSAGVGALQGDETSALYGGGQEVFQSGDSLPSASASRTLEIWVHNTAAAYDPIRYGDVEHGHGFVVHVGGDHITVEASGREVSAATTDGLGHGGSMGDCCDATGWHMVDVTYDGSAVEIYEDGQLIGGGTLGEAETSLPGQGLRLEASSEEITCPYGACEHAGAPPYGIGQAAIYPSRLTSRQIVAHWEAASQAPAGSSVIAGSAMINGSGGAEGARIQACPTSGGACKVDPYAADAQGVFHMVVPDGIYTVTILPPAGSPTGPKIIGPLTLPPSAPNLSATFTAPGGLPEGVSVSSPGRNRQENVVPGLNWEEPSTVTAIGCKGGFGIVFVHATNTTNGQPEVRPAALRETPYESGTYVAQIPPLAPLHGQAGVESSVSCPGHTRLLPDGGAPSGGTSVLIAGSGFTDATAVKFGSANGSSLKILSDREITVVAPPGTGNVPVVVTTATAPPVNVGSFEYFDVSGLDTAAGSWEGGDSVTIHGNGFTNVSGVVFGTMLAPSFAVVNDHEIQAKSPVGFGTVDVQVLKGFALTPASPQAFYSYQGGPPGSAGVSEGVGDAATFTLAAQDAAICSNLPDPSTSPLGQVPQRLCGGARDLTSPTNWLVDSEAALILGTAGGVCLASAVETAGLGCVIAGAAAAYFLWRAGVRVCVLFSCPNGELFNMWIDPSGSVVDTTGDPIGGATATLLEELVEGGSFSPVPASSGAIEPAENPEKTGASGQFDWNALAGQYEVEASAPGCHAPGEEGQANVFTSPFMLPPPAVGLKLTLECPGEAAPTPKVTGLSVPGGPTAGGNLVDISGEGLSDVAAVHFGGNASVHVQPLSPYAVAAVAPAGSGTVDVTVSTPGGTSTTTAADHYTYSAPVETEKSPVIDSVEPNSGPLSGGAVVTIKGSHLAGAFSVGFGGVSSPQVTPISGSEVQAVAPAAAFFERVDVTVTTSSGGSAPTLADGFIYGSPSPPDATSVTLTPSPNPATARQAVGLTAVVAPDDGGGTVAFYADGSSTPIGGCGARALSQRGASYQATCSTTGLTVGSHTLSAAYSGDASYAGSAGSTSVSVGEPAPPSSPPSGDGGGRTAIPRTAAVTANVLLARTGIAVRRGGSAMVKLICTGTLACAGRLTLTAKRGKREHTKTQTIGMAAFSIPAGQSVTIRMALNAIGRALMRVAHGHANALLTIVESSPSPNTQTASVRLALQKATKTKGGKRR